MVLFFIIPLSKCIPAPHDPIRKDVIPTMAESVSSEDDTRPVKVERIRGELGEYPEIQKPRVKRSPKTPAHLAEIFNKVYNDPGKSVVPRSLFS